MFDLPDFGIDGDTIRMRAADDLAGCGAILSARERLTTSGAEADFIAVFTRAEEGGRFGARLLAEAGTLPENTLLVSVESSPLIPGVEQGKGPVIRTGDRVYTFDADAEQVFSAALHRPSGDGQRFQGAAAAYERRRVRGDGVRGVRLHGYRAGIPAWELAQRDNDDPGP